MKKRTISLFTAMVMILMSFSSCTLDSGIKVWETKVPDVVEKDFDEAADILKEKKLHGLISDKIDNKADENKIVEQNPEKGSVVSKGAIVDLVLSAGQEGDGDITVPDLSYYEEDAAKDIVEDLGLEVKTVSSDAEDNHNAAPGAVCWMVPDPGEKLNKGDTVTLRVRNSESENADKSKKVSVPDMEGKDFYEMVKALESDNLFIYITEAEYSTERKDTILSQETAAGTKVSEGTAIGVTVSKGSGKGNISVPDVTYIKADKAEDLIEDSGLKANITYEESDRVAKGTVIKQKKAKGEKAQDGEEIGIVVSSGYTVEVPDVTGKNELEAITELFDAGLSVTAVTKADDTVEKGSVISQDVAAGEKVQLGTLVTVVVSGDKTESTEKKKNSSDSDNITTKSAEQLREASSDDIAFLETVLNGISFCSNLELNQNTGLSFDFDRNDKSASFEYAMHKLLPELGGIFDAFAEHYGWEKEQFLMSKSEITEKSGDPKNKFSDANAAAIINGEKLDIILRNFFNVEPDHGYEFSYFDDGKCTAYYHNGNYYCYKVIAGDLSYEIRIKDKTRLDDGSYKFLCKAEVPGEPRAAKYNYMVTAALKKVDGKNFWSLYKIEKTSETALTTKATTTTTKATTKTTTTTAKVSNSQFLEATQSDFDKLISKYYYWIAHQQSFDYRNCSTKEAIDEYILPDVFPCGLYSAYYGRDSYSLDSPYSSDLDPKGKLHSEYEEACYFFKLDANKIDWMMKNILNVTPDHNYVSGRSYYYDGYYYCTGLAEAGGDGCFEPKITSKERTSDGKYKLTLKAEYDGRVYYTAKVTAALKNLNGKREWSFYSISISY